MEKLYSFLFLDLETTGHDPVKRVDGNLVSWHEIIDIGAVMVNPASGEFVTTPFEVKVRPEHPERCLPNLINHYPARAADGEWKGAVSLAYALKMFFVWIEATPYLPVLGGQNFFFDWSFLTVALTLCDIEEAEREKHFHYTRFDTRSMAMQELGEPWTSYDPAAYSLRNDQLANRLRISEEPVPHKALNGALQSYRVWRALQFLKLHH